MVIILQIMTLITEANSFTFFQSGESMQLPDLQFNACYQIESKQARVFLHNRAMIQDDSQI